MILVSAEVTFIELLLEENMRKVVNKIMQMFDQMGRARAASQLANMGYHEAAKNLMLQK